MVPPLGVPVVDARCLIGRAARHASRPSSSSSSAPATVRPEFRVTDDNAALVADICRRLEGLPLAIELAAARLRVFSLEALRERLGSRLRALGSGPRDLPERQQTLRATIDWSYQLLPSAEQRLLTVLACFSGADIEAVEAVVADLGAALPAVDAVDGLVSLVRQEPPAAGRPRRGDAALRDARVGPRVRPRAARARPELAREPAPPTPATSGGGRPSARPPLGGPDRAEALESSPTRSRTCARPGAAASRSATCR